MIDDDPRDRGEIAKVTASCDDLLKALRQYELWPEEIADPGVDRWPALKAVPNRIGLRSSPAARGALPKEPDRMRPVAGRAIYSDDGCPTRLAARCGSWPLTIAFNW